MHLIIDNPSPIATANETAARLRSAINRLLSSRTHLQITAVLKTLTYRLGLTVRQQCLMQLYVGEQLLMVWPKTAVREETLLEALEETIAGYTQIVVQVERVLMPASHMVESTTPNKSLDLVRGL